MAETPSTSGVQPLILAHAVERTPQGSIRLRPEQVVFERSGSGLLRRWGPENLELVGDLEVQEEPPLIPRQLLFTEDETPSLPNDDILDEELAADLLVDSGSEDEEENFTVEELQELLEEDEEEEDAVDPAEFNWSDDFNTFQGAPETFHQPTGPKIEGTDPLDLFIKIWDESAMQMISHQTNEYAWQTIATASETGISTRSRLNQWVETSVSELYRLMSIFIFMGICCRGRIDEYWTTGLLGMESFRKLMTIDRFWLLMRFLHFTDNNSLLPTTHGEERKLAKIKPVLDHLNAKFAQVYAPRRELSVDESLLLWKGHLSWVQCIRTKAARFGIKTYELCEATTGYCLKIIIYAGKGSTSSSPVFGFTSFTAKIVLKLMIEYLNKGYALFMDNYYNSVPLTRFLKSKKTDVVGTLNKRRTGTPLDIKRLNAKQLPRGHVTSRHCGDVAVVSWKDVKLVTTVSTFHNNDMVLGRRAGADCLKPAVVQHYNRFMGGVDLKDQKLSSYLLERKRGIKWYIKVFRRLLNVSILNAYVIYSENMGPTQRKMSHRQFRFKLAEQLSTRFGEDSRPRMRSSVPGLRRLDVSLGHYPSHRDVAAHERTNNKQDRHKRGRCAQCATKKIRGSSNIICGICDVFLCVGQCWLDYHQVEELHD